MSRMSRLKVFTEPYLRWKRGEISEVEYQNELAREKGFADRNEETENMYKRKGHKNRTEYRDFLAQQRGFKDHKELDDYLARQKGFKNNSDYVIHLRWIKKELAGLPQNMQDNESCSLYLGRVIAEKIIKTLFNKAEQMPVNHPAYDFICGNGFKIDVKSACLTKDPNGNLRKWHFVIRRNTTADFFLLIGFDNREDLNPLHIWLIKSGTVLKNKKVNEMMGISITNEDTYLKDYKVYEVSDSLSDAILICDVYRKNKKVK